MNHIFTLSRYRVRPLALCEPMSTEITMTKTITLKLATTTKVTMNAQGWTKVKGLTALAIDDVSQYTLARFESLEALGAWLEANGFEWIANSRGRYTSLLPLAA